MNSNFLKNFFITLDKIYENSLYYLSIIYGAMAEWLNAPVLKTDVPQGTGGSNPSRSVFFMIAAWRCGRAVIQRIANPSVPYRAGQVQLLSPP